MNHKEYIFLEYSRIIYLIIGYQIINEDVISYLIKSKIQYTKRTVSYQIFSSLC